MKVRTRFAPSPTGFLHVGAARTALFAWLVARHNKGEFILRIEDTDKVREVEGAENHIIESLKWLGIDWDEGTDIGGPLGPYKQSERLNIYQEWAKKLIEQGRAYTDPYSKEELESFRNDAKAHKKPFLYRDYRPNDPPQWDGKKPLRFKSDPKSYAWNDVVLGDLNSGPEAIDDFIIIKSDGYPTYNFCHIVDDALMEITHVIRSQEFISSVPKFLNLYEALGIEQPIMATLPYVMAIDGNKKLSKRDGAKDILDYKKEGFLNEALMNFLATLGWNDGTEQEIFTKEELINKFELGRVQKSPARFDEKRLIWLNGTWIRQLNTIGLYERLMPYLPSSAQNSNKEYLLKIVDLSKDRLKNLQEFGSLTNFFFETPEPNLELIKNDKNLSRLTNKEINDLLKATIDILNDSDFSVEDIKERLNKLLETTNQKPVILFSLIRIATTWAKFSPDLFSSLNILGKDNTLSRLETAKKLFE